MIRNKFSALSSRVLCTASVAASLTANFVNPIPFIASKIPTRTPRWNGISRMLSGLERRSGLIRCRRRRRCAVVHVVVDLLYRGADTEGPGQPCDCLVAYDGFTDAKILETFAAWIGVV